MDSSCKNLTCNIDCGLNCEARRLTVAVCAEAVEVAGGTGQLVLLQKELPVATLHLGPTPMLSQSRRTTQKAASK